MNKSDQVKQIRNFRDSLKEYMEVCRIIWKASRGYSSPDQTVIEQEEKLRESLIEEWGRLERLFEKLGAPTKMQYPAIGVIRPIFDDALSPDFDGSVKGNGLEGAIGSATKAIGLLDALSDSQYKGIYRLTPSIFVGHSFKKENEQTISEILKFISSFPFSVITGEKPTLTGISEGISEKVKQLINDANFIIVILTKDDATSDGKAIPSKWVSDEIAYSLGKGKTVIRIQEEGIEFKPAISGDAEYIAFSRENLAKSFQKLSELLNSLLLIK